MSYRQLDEDRKPLDALDAAVAAFKGALGVADRYQLTATMQAVEDAMMACYRRQILVRREERKRAQERPRP